MNIILIKVLIVSVFGAFVGGTAVRFAYRVNRNDSVYNIKHNLCSTSTKRFRIIELVPILGTSLSILKYLEERYHLARVALVVEIIFAVVFPLMIFKFENLLTLVAGIMAITIFTYASVGVSDSVELEKEQKKIEEEMQKGKYRFRKQYHSRNTGF